VPCNGISTSSNSCTGTHTNANDNASVLRFRLLELAAGSGFAAVFAYLDDERRRHLGRLSIWQHIA